MRQCAARGDKGRGMLVSDSGFYITICEISGGATDAPGMLCTVLGHKGFKEI